MGKINKRILIHSLMFPPDQVSTSYLYGDIVQALIKENFDVTVITTYPHYNYSDDFKKVSLRSGVWRKTNYFGADVYHFPQKKFNRLYKRAFYIIFFHLAFLFKAILDKRYDVILTPSPPLTSGFLSGIIGKMKGSISIYNVQEIYPDVLIKQGSLKNQFIIDILQQIEKYTYKYSRRVVSIDEEFTKRLSSRLGRDKLVTIPNFIDTDLYSPYVHEFDSKLKFENKFIIGYVGNLGKVQDWDLVVQTAKSLNYNNNLLFLIIGGGSEFDKLKKVEDELSNFIVWPYQNRNFIPQINSRIDLHFIAMTAASDIDGLPSKTFAILSSGKPIIAITSKLSPLSKLLDRSGNGIMVNLKDSSDFRNKILEISNGMHFSNETNINGREFILKYYSKPVVTSMYIDLISDLILKKV